MNYYKKLLKTYVLIVSLFVVIISLTFLFGYRYIARSEQAKSNDIVFEQLCGYTDSRLSSLQEIILLLSSSDEIIKYVTENPKQPDRYNRLQVCKLLINLSAINQSDCSLMITKATDDYYCSSSSSGELQFGIKKLSLTEEEFYSIIDSFSDTYSVEVRFIPIKSDTDMPHYIIASRLWVLNSYPLYLFATYEQSNLFAAKDSADYNFALLQDQQLLVLLGETTQEEFIHQLENPSNKLFLSKEFSFYSKHLAYIMTAKPISTPNSMVFLIIGSGVFMLFVCILLTLYLTKRMYAPIKQTLNITARANAADDEFISIQKHFFTLQNNVINLKNSLQQYHTPAQTKFIHNLLMGTIPQTQATELLSKYQLTDTFKNYIVAIIRIDLLQLFDLPEDVHTLTSSIRHQISSIISGNSKLHLFKSIDLTLSEQAYIFCETDAHMLSEAFHNTCIYTDENHVLNITIAIGSNCNDLKDIYISFLHASHLITQAQYTGSPVNVLVHGENQITSDTPRVVYYPLNMEQALISSVINGKNTTWQTLLKNLIYTNQHTNSRNLIYLSLMLTASIDRILNTVNINFDNQLQSYHTLQSCKTYDALYNSCFDIFTSLSNQLCQTAQSNSQFLRNKMLDYIHTYYTKDISLLDLADHLNMSKNYVSSLFKELIGRNFKDYLSEYRVKKACELIKEKQGEIKLMDVAVAVGCNSSSLQRLFVHYKGMPPSQWMNTINNETD